MRLTCAVTVAALVGLGATQWVGAQDPGPGPNNGPPEPTNPHIVGQNAKIDSEIGPVEFFGDVEDGTGSLTLLDTRPRPGQPSTPPTTVPLVNTGTLGHTMGNQGSKWAAFIYVWDLPTTPPQPGVPVRTGGGGGGVGEPGGPPEPPLNPHFGYWKVVTVGGKLPSQIEMTQEILTRTWMEVDLDGQPNGQPPFTDVTQPTGDPGQAQGSSHTQGTADAPGGGTQPTNDTGKGQFDNPGYSPPATETRSGGRKVITIQLSYKTSIFCIPQDDPFATVTWGATVTINIPAAGAPASAWTFSVQPAPTVFNAPC